VEGSLKGVPTEPIPWKVAAAEGPQPERSEPQYRLGLRQLMIAVLVIGLGFAVARSIGAWTIVALLIFGGIGVVVGILVVVVKRRSTQQEGLVWVMSVAARRGMPLGPGVEAYAALCEGGFRARASHLARLLERGDDLPAALDRVPGVLPRDTALLARVGWESGSLADALRDASSIRTGQQPLRRAVAVRLAYLAGSLFVMQTIVSFILYFIVPKFEAIFKDFGVELPWVTILVIRSSHFPGAALVVALAYLAELALLIYLPLAYFGYLGGSLPGVDLVFRRRHTAMVLRALAACVDGDRPITDGLRTLARHYPRWVTRKRLFGALADVEHGEDWCRSLRARGLIRRSDAALLDAARRVGNLAWAMRQLAEGIERRIGYRLMGWLQALFPLVIIALGAFVLLFAVAYFLPLVTLIRRLA
jgi:type II secretory pathway component PulF